MRRLKAFAAAASLVASSAAAKPPGWNPAWDGSVRIVTGRNATFEDTKRNPANGWDIIMTRMLVLGLSPETEPLSDFWAWGGMVESCTKGFEAITDLGDEFGDRVRGRKSLQVTQQRVTAWATQHGPVLSIFFPVLLGDYSQEKEAFPVRSVGKPTLDIARLKFGQNGPGTFTMGDMNTQGPMTNPQWIYGENNVIICPLADGRNANTYNGYSSVVLTIGERSAAKYGQLTGAYLKPFRMTLGAAKLYLSKNVNRGAIYEVQLRIAPESGNWYEQGNRFEKTATVDKVIIHDERGLKITEY